MIKTFFFVSVLMAFSAYAQVGTRIVQTDGPPFDTWTHFFYTSGNVMYICQSPASVAANVVTITGISNSAPAIITAVGHGFHADSNPVVTFTGATGTWTALNGAHVITVVDDDHFSITLDTTAFGSLTGVVVVSTTAPRTTSSVWQVEKITSDSGGNPSSKLWASGGKNNKCSDRATLSYQ